MVGPEAKNKTKTLPWSLGTVGASEHGDIGGNKITVISPHG